MANWNPNANTRLGPEWFPIVEGGITLDAASKSACESIVQTASQVIGTERVAVGAIPTRGGIYVLEVYDNETAVPANVATLTARPNEDVLTAGWEEDDDTVANMYLEIDESTIDVTDFIRPTQAAPIASVTANPYSYRAATGGLSLTGKRILGVRNVIWYASTVAGVSARVRPGLNIGGAVQWGGIQSTSSSSATKAEHLWLYNPGTSKPWTIADVQALDTTDELLIYGDHVFPFNNVSVFQAYCEVVVCDENRLAVGTLSDVGSALTADAWNEAAMLTPTGGAWTKDGAGRHLYLLRRLTTSGALVVPTLDSGEIPNPVSGFTPTLDSTYLYATAMGDAHSTVFGLIQRTTAPAESVDSISYFEADDALVFTGQDAEMEITAVVGNYGRVVARAKSNQATADLLIKVKRRSDNVQFGGTYTLTKAVVDALPDLGSGWRAIDVLLSPVPALTATQFYVEFSSAAAGTGDDYWTVLALDTRDQGNGATFGGTTDRALVNASEADRYDLAVTISTVPTAPADFAVTLVDQTLTGDGSDCVVEAYERPHLAWTATVLAGAFTEYQIDRSDDVGVTWARVRVITTEATAAWDDSEALRGVSTCYRIRVVRSDGAISDWSPTVCVTPSPQCCEWAFTSNVDDSLNLAFSQEGYQIAYQFLDAEDVAYLEAYLRDYEIAISGTEDRGVTFDVPVVVQADQAPSVEGVAVFDALRALQDADLPYVCVLDAKGNRFYADIRVPRGNANTAANYYVALIRVIQVRGTPYSAES